MSNNTINLSPLLEFAGFTVPAGCRRIFITAELEPSNGDPRIQPTGFPDIGPVMYPDPSGKHGLMCLIESEPSMANRLEEVCLADKYTGELKRELAGLPYIKLTETGKPDGRLITTSTIDGHRFASEYIMSAIGRINGSGSSASIASFESAAVSQGTSAAKKQESPATKSGGQKAAAKPAKPEFVAFVRDYLEMTGPDRCPAANVPNIFVLAMEYDPLSLIHGFQISVKKKLTFVGLRSPRALTASILGRRCDRLHVPGIRLDAIGTGEAGQAIFQKQRISAGEIEAQFSIDVGLLASLRLAPLQDGKPGPNQTARFQLLVALSLWKVGTFLDLLKAPGLSLRTECKLRLKGEPKYKAEGGIEAGERIFPYGAIAGESFADKEVNGKKETGLISTAGLVSERSPLVLKFEKIKEADSTAAAAQSSSAETLTTAAAEQ